MKKHLWKKRFALIICILMIFISIPSASFALMSQENTEPLNVTKETSEKKAGDSNGGASEAKRSGAEKEADAEKTPKRKAVNFSADFAPKTAGETATLKKTYRNPAEGIAKATVQLESKKDGYVKSDTDLGVKFGVDLTLNGDYLYDEYEAHTGDAGHPKFDGGDYDAYLEKVDEFLEGLSDDSLAPITYTYDLGTDFTVPADSGNEIKKELKSGNEILGTLTAKKQADGHCVVTIVFNKKVFNRSDVAAGIDVGLEIDKNALKDEGNVIAGWKDDKIVVDVAGNIGPDDPTAPDAKDYIVEKTAKEKVDAPYIDYAIKVDTKTAGKKLETLILEDEIPADMEVVFVKKGGGILNKGSQYSENTYKLENGKLTYQFQKKTLPVTEKEASFEIRLALKSDEYKKEMADGSIDKTGIKNTAKLFNSDQTKEESSGSTAETEMKFRVMSKNGKPEGMNGMRYAWTLDINAQFSQMTKSYIADVICFDDHRFDGDAGIGVYIDGAYKKNVTFKEKHLNAQPTYEDLKKGIYDSVVGNDTEPFYYVYEKEQKHYAVLIVPFGSDYQNHKVQLKYYTNVWLGETADGKPVTVDEWLHSHGGNLPNKNITNDAKFIWDRFIYGNGPGWEDFTWNIDLNKSFDTTVNLGSKSAGTYDEQSQMLKWNFIVNNYGAGMANAKITDILDPTAYNLNNLGLTYVKYDRSTGKKGSPSEISENTGAVHYTLDKNTGRLAITMPPEISANDYYEITLQIQVADPGVLTQQGTKKDFSNTAVFEAVVGGTDVRNEYPAKKDLTNTLITKKAVGTYDYSTKELAWQVGIDPNHIALTDLAVTDELPVGNSFEKLTKVTRVDKNGIKHEKAADLSASEQSVTLDNGVVVTLYITEGKEAGSNYKKDKAVFKFSGSGSSTDYEEDSYIFDLTTKITDEAYLTKVFQGSADVKVKNNIQLDGKYRGQAINGSADAEAVHTIKSGIITKNGKYLDSEGKISWNITLNQDKLDIGGMKLIEEIDGQPLEIDDSSFVLYTKDLDETTTEYKPLQLSDFETVGNDGFIYKIPEDNAIKHKTLVLTFDTYLTKSAEAADIHNKVRLVKDGEIYQESEESNGGYDGSFDIDKYVQAAKNPILQVMKTSSNNDPDTPKLPLAGAEFTAQAYGEASPGIYNNLDDKYKKTGTTNDQGKLNFVNLKRNYVYKLSEKTAPAGYELDAEANYYIFTDDPNLDIDGDGKELLTVGGESVKAVVLKANQLTGTYPQDALTRTLNNHPKAGMKISFTKKDPLDGSFNDSDKKADFKLVYEKDWLAPKAVKSDASGQITFDAVDPGNYKLIEVLSDDPYDQGAVFNVTMKTDGDYTIEHDKGNAQILGSKGSYVIKNEYAKGTIRLKKVGSDSGHINLQGAVFQLYDHDDKAISSMKATTGNDGVAAFCDVPYDPNGYTVKEITPPGGYSTILPGSSKMPVAVKTIAAADITAALNKANNQQGGAKTFLLDFTADTGRIENDRTTGSITLKKVDSNNKVLKDREFQLIYNDSDGYNSWKKGHVVDTKKTGSGGTLTFSDVPYGNYTLNETSSSCDIYETYCRDFSLRAAMQTDLEANRKDNDGGANDNTFAIDLSKQGNPNGDIVNKLLTAGFSVKKQDATTGETMEGVSFTLKGTDADGKAVEISKETNASGIADWTDIPIGADQGSKPYILTETKHKGYDAPIQYNVYVKSEDKGTSPNVENRAVVTMFQREAEGSNGTVAAMDNDKYSLSNQPITGTIQFTKTDAAGDQNLPGAQFRLYRMVNGSPVTDKGEWSKANPLGYHTATSHAEGLIKIEQVEYGNYQLKEIKPPAGYKLWAGKKEISKSELTISDDTVTFSYTGDKIKNSKTDLKFWKQDQFGNAVKGAELKLSGTFANGDTQKVWNSGDAPYALAADLVTGNTYKLSETSAPASGLYKKASDVTFTVNTDGTLKDIRSEDPAGTVTYTYDKANETMTLTDAYYLADIKLIKKDLEDTSKTLSKVAFSLYQQKGASPAKEDVLIAENLVTGADGSWSSAAAENITNPITKAKLSEGLSIGNYYFVETATRDDYVLDTEPKSFKITADEDAKTLEKEITNKAVNASIELIKLDSEDGKKVPHTTFTLTRTKDRSGKAITESGIVQITDTNGSLKFTGLQKGTYTLEETTSNANYQSKEADKFACEFVVTDLCSNETLNVNSANKGNATAFELQKTKGTWSAGGVTNKRRTGSVSLTKLGDTNGSQKPLKGAEFTLYFADGVNQDNPVQKGGKDVVGITGQDGSFTINDLPWAKYYLMETKAPDGFIMDKTHHDFEIKAGSLSKGFQAIAGGEDIVNNATSFTIAKKADDALLTGLPGAEFTVEGIFADDTESKAKRFAMSSVDSQTIYQQLVTGQTYIVKETKAPEGYELNSTPITIAVGEDGTITADNRPAENKTATVKDHPIEIKLHKTDDTGLLTLAGGVYKVVPASGSKFAAFDGETTIAEISVTEANIQARLSGRLIAGNSYILTETKAPEGYEVAKPVAFKVDEYGAVELTKGAEIAKITNSDPQTPTINLKDDKIRIKIEKANTDKELLHGAVFTVTPDPDSGSEFAITGDETVPPAAIEVPVTLDENGDLEAQKELDGRLITGNRYVLSEKVQPSGYIRLQVPIMVEVMAGENLKIIKSQKDSAVVLDEGKTIRITDQANKLVIRKQDELDKSISTNDLELQIKDSRDKVVNTLNKDNQDAGNAGTWTLNAQFTAGETYTITESKVPYGYLKAADIKFTMKEDGSITIVSGADHSANAENSNNLYLENDSALTVRDVMIQGAVLLHKEDSQGLELQGVKFDLYQMRGDEPDIKADTKINKESLTTNSMGTVKVDALGEGKYYFIETETHDDKLLDETPTKLLEIDGAQHHKTVSIDEVNKDFLTKVSLKKADAEDGSAISGTQFTLYKVEEGKETAVCSDITDETGNLVFQLVAKGDYKIVETLASKGYELEKDKPFTAKFKVKNTNAFQNKMLKLTEHPSDTIKTQYNLTYENASFYEEADIANQRIPGKLTLRKADQADNKALDGVTFTLYKEKTGSGFEKIWDFITGSKYEPVETMKWSQQTGDTGAISVSGLAWGKYYIEETKAADGYKISKDARYDFTIGRNANDITLTADAGTITNLQTKIAFIKVGKYIEACSDVSLGAFSPDSFCAAPGAEFTISKKETPDTILKTAVSDKQGNVEFYKLSPGTYYIGESKAPKGYLKDSTIYEAKISQTGEFSGLSPLEGKGGLVSGDKGYQLVNDVTRSTIEIKKVSEQKQDQPIAGSVYGLYRKVSQSSAQQLSAAKGTSYTVAQKSSDTDGLQLIAKATTGKDGYLRFEGVLMGVDYVIRELVAPPGSQISEKPITITYNVDPDTGKAVISHYKDGNGTAQIDPNTGQIIWKEPSIMIQFDKKDEDGNLLKGAQLELQTKDGEVIDSWTSQDKQAHIIYGDRMDGKIRADETYRLVETDAPEGYQSANPVPFTVHTKPTGPQEAFVQTITMVDRKIPAEASKPASGTAGGSSAETGDDFPIQLWIILLLLSGGVAGFVLRKQRGKK